MQGLLKYDYADPDATGTAHANIDKLLAGNREETARSIGTIGPTPWLETAEGKQTLLDMVTGSPGSAIGRVSKAAVTGGQQALGNTGYLVNWMKKALGKRPSGKMSSEQAEIKLKKYFDEMMDNAKKPKRKPQKPKRKPQIPYELEEQFAEEALSKHNWNNKVNKSRIALEKAFSKHLDEGQKFTKPSLEQSPVDPVTSTLRTSKLDRNWDTSSKAILQKLRKYWKANNSDWDAGF